MKKAVAVFVLAAMPLFADVIIPEDEKRPRPEPKPRPASTTTAPVETPTTPPTETAASVTTAPAVDTAPRAVERAATVPAVPAQKPRSAQPILWFSVAGVALVIILAARRSRSTLRS